MKMLASMILLSAITAGMIACSKTKNGEGPRARQERYTTGFTSIELRANADVYYTQGSLKSISVDGPQYILDDLETIAADGRLIIRFSNGKTWQGHESIRIHITAPDVSSFSLNSSGSIFFMNTLQKDALLLYNNGSGDISLKDIAVRNLEAYATNTGGISAETGNALSATVKSSGSGDINLSAVNAQTVTAHNTAAGKIQVKAAAWLKAKIEGSGSIFYKGYPQISSQISGPGYLVHY